LGVKEYTSTIQLVNFWDFDMDRSSLVGLWSNFKFTV
jgi:hypothetical protein